MNLIIANEELVFHNKEKEKRAAELVNDKQRVLAKYNTFIEKYVQIRIKKLI